MKKLLCLAFALLLLTTIAWGQDQGTISGSVMGQHDGAQMPIPFAHVLAFPVNGDHPAGDVHADSLGNYVMRVPFGDFHVRAEAMRLGLWYDNVLHREEATPVHVAADQNPAGIDFLFAQGPPPPPPPPEDGFIGGRIMEIGANEGIPMANVKATLLGDHQQEFNTRSEWGGVYAFIHLPAGYYTVEAWKEGWSRGLFPETLSIDTNGFREVNIFLERTPSDLGSITGIITNTSNNEPISGAHVIAHGRNWRHHFGTESLEDGAYLIDGLPTDIYRIEVLKQGFLPGHYPDSIVIDGNDVTGINVALTPLVFYGISGVVTRAADGLPLAEAHVIAIDVNHHDRSFMGVTGDDGAYMIVTPPGEYIVQAVARGYYRLEYPEHVTVVDHVVEGVNFSLTEINFGSIAGVVTDSLGAPIPRAIVEASGRGRFSRQAVTDSTGAYLLDNLIPGIYRVRAFKRGYYPGVYRDSVAVADGQDITGINIILMPFDPQFDGTIAGVVTDDSTGAPIANARVLLIGRRDSWGRHLFHHTITNADGSYQFDNLPQIPFKVAAAKRGYIGEFYDNARHFDEAAPVTPNASGINFALHARLYGPRLMGGSIRLSDGTVPEGCVVYANVDGQIADMVIADIDGYYSFDDMAPGTYDISAFSLYGEGELGYPADITIDDMPDADIVLSPTSVDEAEVLPVNSSLSQNYPNPFNAQTSISFAIVYTGDVELSIFNVAGQKVATLAQGELNAGSYNVIWNGSDSRGNTVSSGVYYYRLKTDGSAQTMKMTLLK